MPGTVNYSQNLPQITTTSYTQERQYTYKIYVQRNTVEHSRKHFAM
jgi:hypothetical protein